PIAKQARKAAQRARSAGPFFISSRAFRSTIAGTAMNETLNADPLELAKFSEQAHRWWDPDSEFGPLHAINPLRLGWIDGLAGLNGKRAVDIGCGGGIPADSMARKGAEVLGIDLSTKALRVAQLHALEAGTPNVAYREISAEALAQEQAGS